MRWWYNALSLSVCQEMKVFFFVLMLLIIHRSVKRCNRKDEQRKSHKLRSVRFHLAMWFSQVNGNHCRGRGSQVYNNRAYFHSFSQHTAQFSLRFRLGKRSRREAVQRWVVVAASSMFARLFSITHELWIWCIHVSHPTMPCFSGVTRKCDKESILSQRRPDSIRIW